MSNIMQAIHYQSDIGHYQDIVGNKVIVICSDEVYPAAGLDVVVEETESLEDYLLKHYLTLTKDDRHDSVL